MFPVKDNIRTEGVAFATLLLMGLNVAVYLWSIDDGGTFWGGPTAAFVTEHETLPASLFVNGALLPLAANLMFLWIFGNSLEQTIGRVRFVGLYLLGGLITLGVALLIGGEPAPVVGATGAVAGVIGAHLVLHPRAEVLTAVLLPFLFTIVAINTLVFLGLWVALQVAFWLTDLTTPVGSDEVVAYLAPAAGLLFGAISGRLKTRLDYEPASS